MLLPHSSLSQPIMILALALLVGLLTLRAVRKGRTEFQRFKAFERTRNRQRMFAKWLRESFLTFGGATAVILIIAWRYLTPFIEAVDRWPVSNWFRGLVDASGSVIPITAGVLAVVFVGGTIVAVFLVRETVDVPTLGDIGSLLPRNRRELGFGFALSVNAGLVEELLFRLALPALIFGATGNALVAVIGSILLFGGLHVYQGWPGIAGAIVIGALLMGLYLATGSILTAIVAHMLIDLRSLVLIPVMVFGVHRTRV